MALYIIYNIVDETQFNNNNNNNSNTQADRRAESMLYSSVTGAV